MPDVASGSIVSAEDDGRPESPTLLSNLSRAAQLRRREGAAVSDGEAELSDSELFEELEKELDEDDERGGIMSRLREGRMMELKRQLSDIQKRRSSPQGRGKLIEPSTEKELIQILSDSGGDLENSNGGMPIVVHFYHKEFRRCDIMKGHLESLASQHPETLFLCIPVLSSPFLVEKLSIKVLPCLITFGAKAQVKDRIIGFEDLGNSDGFTTRTLEWRLNQGGALRLAASAIAVHSLVGFPSSNTINSKDDDDDLDWD